MTELMKAQWIRQLHLWYDGATEGDLIAREMKIASDIIEDTGWFTGVRLTMNQARIRAREIIEAQLLELNHTT